MALLVCLIALQESELRKRMDAAIYTLSSDSIEDREHAELELRNIGVKAIPYLNTKLPTDCTEVNNRIQIVLRRLTLCEFLPKELKHDREAVEWILRSISDQDTAIFLALIRHWGAPIHTADGMLHYVPYQKRAWYHELEALVTSALRGARTYQDLFQVIRACGSWELKSSISELKRLLPQVGPEMKSVVRNTIKTLQIAKVIPLIVELQNHPQRELQNAGRSIGNLRSYRLSHGLAPEIRKYLSSSNPELRCRLITMLGLIGGKEDSRMLRGVLRSSDSCCRRKAAWALVTLDYAH